MNRFLLIAGALMLCSLAQAQAPEQLFEQGNAAFQKQDYQAAVTAYESILHTGEVSGDLYYNLGNAYYRMGNIPRAMLNYERALRLMPTDEDLRHNLRIATAQLQDRIEPIPRLFLWDWWDALKGSFSLEGATWSAYAAFCFLLAAVGLLRLGKTYVLRAAGLWGSVGFAVLLAFFLFVFLDRAETVQRTDEAIMMEQTIAVKNSPDERGSDAFVLHAGVKVRTVDHVGTWVQIRIADGKTGWVPASSMEVI